MSLSSGETVRTKWRTCLDKIMTTTANTVENQEKTTQNKIKVPQLTNENTNKIAGSNLLKPMQRHCKFIESKVEECNKQKRLYKDSKLVEVTKKMSLKIGVREFNQSSVRTTTWSKN